MNESGQGQLRIIAGKWRSRKISFPDQAQLRPTPDRVRETLFNWLQADVPGSVCLDLFAGSGALGFEAASRGAARVTMVEQDKNNFSALESNTRLLDADNIDCVLSGAVLWLEGNMDKYDLVFLDPPYKSDLLERCCMLLERRQSLREHAKIYIEHARGDVISVPANWECLKDKSAGQVVYKLFERNQ